MPDFTDISPHLDVRISPRAKRLSLRLDTTKRRVCLIIPKRASLKNAYIFAFNHRNWIEDKIKEIPTGIPFSDGAVISILGKDRRIVIERTTSRLTEITLTDDELQVKTKLDDIEPRIARFLKKLASEEFLKMAQEKAARIDKKVVNLTVRDMKTRWGSCSTDGRMALSWRLMFAPFEAYEYVISHEVAHLLHPNHGPRFWKLCEELSTDFSTGHTWMKVNGGELMRFGNKAA
jgi:predicted metal-dependent hydrolase